MDYRIWIFASYTLLCKTTDSIGASKRLVLVRKSTNNNDSNIATMIVHFVFVFSGLCCIEAYLEVKTVFFIKIHILIIFVQ